MQKLARRRIRVIPLCKVKMFSVTEGKLGKSSAWPLFIFLHFLCNILLIKTMVLIECPNIPAERPRDGIGILLHGPAAGRQGGGPLVRLERHPGRHAAALARRFLNLSFASAKCAVACVDTAKVFVLRAIHPPFILGTGIPK